MKVNTKDIFSNLPIPFFSSLDLEIYTKENLMAKQKIQWDSQKYVQENFNKKTYVDIATIDGGGNKITCAVSRISKTLRVSHSVIETYINPGGKNFVSKILDFKKHIERRGIKTIGISFGGLMDGTVFLGSDYLAPFSNDLKKYNNDFAELFKECEVHVLNDAVAINVGMSVHICIFQKENYIFQNQDVSKIKNIITLIMGGGMGGGIMKDLQYIYEAEPGHVQAGNLNKYHITKKCPMWNDGRICQQHACGGSVSFVEKVVSDHLKIKVDGKKAEQLLLEGNNFVKDVYHTAASCYARTFIGMTKLFKLGSSSTLYVLHGGGSKTLGFTSQVEKIVEKNLKKELIFINTSSLSENICLDGAAFYATSFLT